MAGCSLNSTTGGAQPINSDAISCSLSEQDGILRCAHRAMRKMRNPLVADLLIKSTELHPVLAQ